MAADLAVAQEHAQWWSSDLKPKIEASQSSVAEDVDGAISAWVADGRSSISRRELTREKSELRADSVEAGKPRELEAWEKFDVFSPHEARNVQRQIAHARCVLTWGMADGKKRGEARVVAEGFQGPDLKGGLADTSGCVSLRSSHLQVVSLSAIRKWELWSSDIRIAFSQAGGFDWDVFLHAPRRWGPTCTTRAWKLKAPAYGFNDALVAFRRSLKRYLLKSELSMMCVGVRCQASTFGPCSFFVSWVEGRAVGTFTTHNDDFLGCGEPDTLTKLRKILEQHSGE